MQTAALFLTVPALTAAAAVAWARALRPPSPLQMALTTFAGQMRELELALGLALLPAVRRANEALRAFERAWTGR